MRNTRTALHLDGNQECTYNKATFIQLPNEKGICLPYCELLLTLFILGDTVAGCHYNVASVKHDELWFLTEHGSRIAHAVGNKEFVSIKSRFFFAAC